MGVFKLGFIVLGFSPSLIRKTILSLKLLIFETNSRSRIRKGVRASASLCYPAVPGLALYQDRPNDHPLANRAISIKVSQVVLNQSV